MGCGSSKESTSPVQSSDDCSDHEFQSSHRHIQQDHSHQHYPQAVVIPSHSNIKWDGGNALVVPLFSADRFSCVGPQPDQETDSSDCVPQVPRCDNPSLECFAAQCCESQDLHLPLQAAESSNRVVRQQSSDTSGRGSAVVLLVPSLSPVPARHQHSGSSSASLVSSKPKDTTPSHMDKPVMTKHLSLHVAVTDETTTAGSGQCNLFSPSISVDKMPSFPSLAATTPSLHRMSNNNSKSASLATADSTGFVPIGKQRADSGSRSPSGLKSPSPRAAPPPQQQQHHHRHEERSSVNAYPSISPALHNPLAVST